MKVATWRGAARFTIDDVPDAAPGPGQALVAVQAAGICGTDVHATQGLFPWKPLLVMGHEYTGVVQEVGRGVSRRLVGRTVGCEPSYGCGQCPDCAEGRVSQCARCTRVGGFAERVVLPVSCLHALPRGLDAVTAAMTEPAACCLANLEMFRMPRGATVLVIGGGIMGLLTMALAHRRGARRLILSDPIAERRAMAKRLGASVVIDPARESLRDRVLGLTHDRGADVVCEAVGKPELVAQALDLYDVHFREIRIHGAFGRGGAYRRALALMPKLRVRPTGHREVPARTDRGRVRPRHRRPRREDDDRFHGGPEWPPNPQRSEARRVTRGAPRQPLCISQSRMRGFSSRG